MVVVLTNCNNFQNSKEPDNTLVCPDFNVSQSAIRFSKCKPRLTNIILIIKSVSFDLHSVVEKSIQGDLRGRLRVHLRPGEVQDERIFVFKRSYLLYNIKVEGKRRYTEDSTGAQHRGQYRGTAQRTVQGDSTHPKLKGHRTDFLETLIPLIDGAKSLQLHLCVKEANRMEDLVGDLMSGRM